MSQTLPPNAPRLLFGTNTSGVRGPPPPPQAASQALAVLAFVFLGSVFAPTPTIAQSFEKIADGLEEPWGLAFLPDGGFLVTERDGALQRFAADGGAALGQVSGLPRIAAVGQGGLLDVMIPRDFATSRKLWLSYAAPVGDGLGTAAGFGRLSEDGQSLEEFRPVMEPLPRPGGRHFGARLVEGVDGTVYLTTGDRGSAPLAQDPTRPEGKVLAFTPDGAPKTHPDFSGLPGVFPGLHSLGHRNIQGAALDAQGQLWTVEHGARGGDELNLVQGGQNHGWPVISYGTDYDGSKIGEGTSKPGLEQPVTYWVPSIAPSGLTIHSGASFPEWKGHMFTGSLNSGFLSQLDPSADFAETRIEAEETGRVRDVVEGPDGRIWFLSVIDGAVYALSP
jgi:aldose sugar dehydrogenase